MTTDWLSAIGILLAGLVVGFMFVYASMRKKSAAVPDDLERRDLEAKRDALIAQLRAGDLAPDERTRIEREAAEVLRALDRDRGGADAAVRPSPAPAVPAAVPRPSSSALAGFLWGAGSVIALVLIGWFVTKNATPKDAPTQAAPMAAAPTDTASVEQLEASVKANPDDSESRIALAKAYLDRENLMGVFEQTSAVLAKNPNDARAQTYQAIVRMAMGQQQQAKTMLDAATKTDPKLVDAWVALAYLRTRESDAAGATAAIEEAIKQRPDEEQRLRAVLAQMQGKGAPANAAATSAAPPPAASGPAIHVTVNIDPAARGTGILYIMARDASSPGGPPAAVKRIEPSSFPINVDLTAADSMMGQPLPKSVRVEARLDGDGNVMTKDPADPKAAQDAVALGASVTLTLK